jgi:flagellar biosynthesis protein FlhB
MANDDRTEKATPRHRKRAREKGQVVRSPDLGGSVVMIGGLLALSLTGGRIVEAAAGSFRDVFADISQPTRVVSVNGVTELMHAALATVGLAVLPVGVTCMLAGVVASVGQVGFKPSPQALKPDFRRINPVSGARNVFGPNAPFEAVKALVKVGVVAAVAALAILPSLTALASIVGISPHDLGVLFGTEAMGVAQRAAFAYLVIGFVDYAWRRHRHEQQLKMTKQQVKDEQRQYGISNEVKAALRRRAMAAARARMMAAVPDADVVVTNPTHYAVALTYDGSRTAPEVVAKGKDLIAAQIRRVAEENGVPIVADPPLARALHQSVEVGQVIPQELYAAVARVLAFVYRVAGRRRLAS